MKKNHMNDKFKYRGKEYGVGTLYTTDGGKTYYRFVGINLNGDYHFMDITPYAGGLSIYPPHIDSCELTIIEPDEDYKLPKTGNSYVDTTVGWIWYIIIMLSLILFNDAVFGWLVITIIFINWRKNKLKGD